MRTPREQSEYLNFGRFGLSPPKRRSRAWIWVVAGLFGLVTAFVIAQKFFPKTLLEEEQPGGDYVRYGFTIQRPRFGSLLMPGDPVGTFITFRAYGAGTRMTSVFVDEPRLRLKNVKKQEWLAGNQAVLLDLDADADLGSYTQPDEKFIVYNFKTGDLRACSSFERVPCDDLQSYVRTLR